MNDFVDTITKLGENRKLRICDARNKRITGVKINELIDNGTVDRVIGWKAGEFCYDVSPAIFTKENLDELVYNSFCGANQSKF